MRKYTTGIACLAVGVGIAGISLSRPAARQDELSQEIVVTGVSWFSIANGGARSANGDFELVATIGQMTAGEASGDSFYITSGFTAGARETEIFTDGLETGDTSRWSGSN